jgi:hypothetical protein
MKTKIAIHVTLFLLAISIPVMAKETPPRPFQLQQMVTLNGAQVPAGIYELSWETERSTVRVTLRKGGEVVAAAKGVLVKNGTTYSQDAALLRVNPDGTRSLIEIRIAGASKAIVFPQSDAPVGYTALKR